MKQLLAAGLGALRGLVQKRTLGARALVLRDHQILLIEHTYMPGWYTIGGGVEAGESVQACVVRELNEEAGIIVQAAPKLFQIYHAPRQHSDDYVALFIVDNFIEENRYCTTELKAKTWFPLDALPNDLSPATHRRIDEYLGRVPVSDLW